MTIKDIVEFAEAHGCGEFTPVVADVSGVELWLNSPFIENGVLMLRASNVQSYFNMHQLTTFGTALAYPASSPIAIKFDATFPVKGLARGATPNAAAKALVLQA